MFPVLNSNEKVEAELSGDVKKDRRFFLGKMQKGIGRMIGRKNGQYFSLNFYFKCI